MVEATEFPELAERYGVFAVPKVVINDAVSFEGALPEHLFALYVLKAVDQLSGEERREFEEVDRQLRGMMDDDWEHEHHHDHDEFEHEHHFHRYEH
jgi:hypothetical protein